LILAEIELPAENTPFKKPEWLGEEVTGDPSYYNATM
jgi:adenylate cyclase